MEGEQNFAIGVSVSDSNAAAQISGWDMHPTFLSDAELLGAFSWCCSFMHDNVACCLPQRTFRNHLRRANTALFIFCEKKYL